MVFLNFFKKSKLPKLKKGKMHISIHVMIIVNGELVIALKDKYGLCDQFKLCYGLNNNEITKRVSFFSLTEINEKYSQKQIENAAFGTKEINEHLKKYNINFEEFIEKFFKYFIEEKIIGKDKFLIEEFDFKKDSLEIKSIIYENKDLNISYQIKYEYDKYKEKEGEREEITRRTKINFYGIDIIETKNEGSIINKKEFEKMNNEMQNIIKKDPKTKIKFLLNKS